MSADCISMSVSKLCSTVIFHTQDNHIYTAVDSSNAADLQDIQKHVS